MADDDVGAINVGNWSITTDGSGNLVVNSGTSTVLKIAPDHLEVLGKRILCDQDPIYLMQPDSGSVLNSTTHLSTDARGWNSTPYWRTPPGDGDSNLQVCYGTEA